ncbi:radical SAM protein [Pseudophaeobacter profundi]|uniref:radical SAM protein n=1 Tax=Pseudophaeobacter profundi TaxID=3034152 RepID=UPI00242C7098|nr:radical SAM protein [Pseudophaeobacter profundi]
MSQESQLAKLGLFRAKVPRYTSYPIPENFSLSLGPEHFASWLEQIPEGSQIGLYLHIPYCQNLCWFCMCRTQGARSIAQVEAYVTALQQEIALLKPHLPNRVQLARLHWGGGTPTILPPELIATLSTALAGLAPLAPKAEFSVEIDPNDFDQPRCDALMKAGMTRASIGVQGFGAETQQAIGRSLPFETLQNCVEMLRRGGIRALSTDLLFGLPHQSQAQITQDITDLLSLSPDRVALYGYKHLPAQIRRQAMIPSETLPTPEARLALFESARHCCLQAGYQQIGLESFVRPGDSLIRARDSRNLRREFQDYSDAPTDILIGLGASAISRLPQGYVQNAPGTAHYMDVIDRGTFASARGHAFQGDDRLRGRMIEALLCHFTIRSADLVAEFPEAAPQVNALLDKACAAFPGVLIRTAEGVDLPPDARPLARVVAQAFDAYADTPPQRIPAA